MENYKEILNILETALNQSMRTSIFKIDLLEQEHTIKLSLMASNNSVVTYSISHFYLKESPETVITGFLQILFNVLVFGMPTSENEIKTFQNFIIQEKLLEDFRKYLNRADLVPIKKNVILTKDGYTSIQIESNTIIVIKENKDTIEARNYLIKDIREIHYEVYEALKFINQ